MSQESDDMIALEVKVNLELEGQTEELGMSFKSDGGPMLECKHQAKVHA